MSFLAKLYIEDKERNVLKCRYEFFQEIDYSGRAIAKPKSGLIKLTIESSNDTDILHWVISSQELKTGEIIFFRRDSSSANKKLKFTDALCVEYTEDFNAEDKGPMQIHLALSARIIEIDSVRYDSRWVHEN